jgi:hypothetical protein
MFAACHLCSVPVSDADQEESVDILMSEHSLIARKANALPALCVGCVRSRACVTMIAWYETDNAPLLLAWGLARGRDPRIAFEPDGTWTVVVVGRSATFPVTIGRRALQARLDELLRPTG